MLELCVSILFALRLATASETCISGGIAASWLILFLGSKVIDIHTLFSVVFKIVRKQRSKTSDAPYTRYLRQLRDSREAAPVAYL